MITPSFLVKQFPADQARVQNDVFYFTPHMIGRTVLICGKKRSRFPFQCLVGPDWHCMLLTYTLIGVPSGLFIHYAAYLLHPAVFIVAILSTMLLLLLFSLTACSDPGTIYQEVGGDSRRSNGEGGVSRDETRRQRGNDANRLECGACGISRPKSASHCYECQTCTDELDHHCPWTGKCIGKRNLFFFQMFTAYLVVHIILILAGLLWFSSRGQWASV
uniref:Palmitoyltransferase n=1 Tax=Fibrocapsa japonica TaxID=94617 RepID=A0A7S2V8J0_9STRA|mmetsp:Transcript_8085/g.12384  ORF Transcript_8085/g.12384 Transcript_8085/m.12384 type:complete len:218 (+) Transcript_8085:87-740(+)